MKKWKKILLLLSAVILLFFISGFLTAYLYEKEIKAYAINQINAQLNTEIAVEEVNFSVLKKFPYASIEFIGVSAKEVFSNNKQKNNLFEVKQLNFQFNIIDIWNKKYRIKKIELNEGVANIKIFKDGTDNFHFWKTSTDTNTVKFDLALKKVILKNIKINYSNTQKNQKIELKIKETYLSGNFSNEEFEVNLESDFFADQVFLNETPYVKNQNIALETVLKVNSSKKSIEINKGNLQIADLSFNLKGKAVSEPNILLDIEINSKELDIQSLLSLTPEKYKEQLKDYQSSGNFFFNALLKGQVGGSQNPIFKADFGIRNGEIFIEDSNIKLQEVNLKGSYSNGAKKSAESTLLNIEEFTCKMGSGKIKADFSIENFLNPNIKINTQSSLNLSELKEFIKNDSIETLSGNINIDARFSGNIKNLKNYSVSDFQQSKTSGKMLFKDVNIKLTDKKQGFSNLNGEFLFDNNDIIINSLKGNIINNDFELKGFLRNVISYFLIADQKLVIDASLKSNNLNLDELLSDENSKKSDTSYKIGFSKDANLYLDLQIGYLKFKKFDARNISGKVAIKDNKLITENLNFKALDGFVKLNGLIDAADTSQMLLSCQGQIEKINIQKMFYQFENFSQNTLQDKHIKGLATADIEFISELDSKLNFNLDKLYTRIKIDITKGELINFEPMKNLSRFISVEELEHIRFSNLKNEIEIRNSRLTIPKTEISSNALNLSLSGSHTFKHEIDYRIKVLLSDLLANKAKKAKKENTEFGIEQADDSRKMALFIKVYGTVDKPKFAYDKIGLTEKIKEDIKTEKQNLKSILKEEFGIYKNDSTVKVPDNKPKAYPMQFEWEENKKEAPEKPKNKFEKKEKSKFDRLLDKVAGPENKNEFEEDKFNP